MISADLQHKCALVTGGASGIGLATAEMLARNGARVAINDLPGSVKLDEEVSRLQAEGLHVYAAPADMSNTADVDRMVAEAVDVLGGLHILVNNAATPGTRNSISAADLERQDDAFWQQLLGVNLVGPFRCIRAAQPYLSRDGGAVVNVASTAAFGGGGSSTTYASCKGGLVTMTRELAKGLGPDIRVNAIAPGWVKMSGWDCSWDEAEAEEAALKLPLQRIGEPQDYAEAIFYLCVAGHYITGQTLIVDGGLMAGG
ncbi:SDR family NAD(P)-dependent oxidoreductase [Aliamphritea ceti]|uniref:SDR family NAD(P)-dependent oxidoreductase n=1 Tax=Aliamphritea ceti TaxID=1524258 RepID=UPI0021C26D36|nr:SDR family oxidoreductase [Aliamphritea ceti]